MKQARIMEASAPKRRETVPTKKAAPGGSHSPKRGRPTAEQASSIDQSIVDAALAMFLIEGFDAVGMNQVAEKARVSKGTLYARYPSKEALFSSVIERSIARWAQEASVADALFTDDIEQRLRHHATTIATWLGKPDVVALQRLVLSVGDRFPALAEVMRSSGYNYIVGLIARDMKQASSRDGRKLRDPEVVARLLVAGITGVHLQETNDSADIQGLHVFAQRVVDVVVAGSDAW